MAQQSNKNSEYINPHEVTPDKPFHIAFLREITDQYDASEISYGRMVEMLNEVAMKWHNSTISKTETVKTMAQQRLKEIEQLAEKMWEGCHGCDEMDKYMWTGGFMQGYLMSMQIYKEQRIKDYNAGYTDAQCNHINDAENYANEQDYLNDKEITDYTIGPFGTPENK